MREVRMRVRKPPAVLQTYDARHGFLQRMAATALQELAPTWLILIAFIIICAGITST
jgi:hypothetical protein